MAEHCPGYLGGWVPLISIYSLLSKLADYLFVNIITKRGTPNALRKIP